MSKLLLLSNSTMPGTAFFTWPRPHVQAFLPAETKNILFIPFAAVTVSYDAYEQTVSGAFAAMGWEIRSIHRAADKNEAVRNAGAIVTGGGNSFALLSKVYAEDLTGEIRSRVAQGIPYIGWSAGANLACPTIMTTNDMPVVTPPSFAALNLIPFQINPHYHELRFANQGGETRRERLEEFLVMNPDKKVLGLPEGMFLLREGDRLTVGGEGTAKLYQSGQAIVDVRPDTDVSFLL